MMQGNSDAAMQGNSACLHNTQPSQKFHPPGHQFQIGLHFLPLLCAFWAPGRQWVFHALPNTNCLHWPLICQELLMDTRTWCKASFGHLHLGESRPFQDDTRWLKFGSVAHSNFGWYKEAPGQILPSLDAAVFRFKFGETLGILVSF